MEEVKNRVDRTIFREILKCAEKRMDDYKLARLRALFQLIILARKVEKDAIGFVKKLLSLAEYDEQEANSNARKVRKIAKRTMWLS